MSLLARFWRFLGLGIFVFLGIYFFIKSRENQLEIEHRYAAKLESSISDPAQVINQLTSRINSNDITENELVLLFELILDSSTHSIDPLWSILEDRLAGQPSLDWQVIEACALYRRGSFAEARRKLEQLAADNPTFRRANYEYQKMRWLTGTMEDRVAAKIGLFELGRQDDRWAYKSLRTLAFSSLRVGLLKDDLIRANQQLRRHQLVNSQDFLRASEIILSVDEKQNFDQTFEHIKKNLNNKVSPVDFGYWLIQNNHSTKAMDIITSGDALSGEDAFFIHFQALLENNQTSEAQALFEKASHLGKAKKLQANAYLQLAKGEGYAISQFFKDAGELRSARSLLDVSRLALLQGMGKISYEAFQQAWKINSKKFNLSQANQFLQFSLNSRNTEEAHQITAEILRRYPEKFGNANNHCYLSLLLGEEVDVLEKEAVRITTAFPGSPTFLSTLALAKLLAGKPREALDAMNQRGPVPLNHGERALLACVLEGNGNKEDAKKVAQGLEERRMLPEEWQLLKKYQLTGS